MLNHLKKKILDAKSKYICDNHTNKVNMKKLLILSLSISLAACGTTGMQGNPGAILVGAQAGGMVGSIIGSSSDSFTGWAIGNVVGTIAGAAIGNAISTPHESQQQSVSPRTYQQQDNSYPETNIDADNSSNQGRSIYKNATPFLPIMIQNIRFVDENNDHIIQAGEFCKLIFELYNSGDQIMYNIYPNITLSNSKVGVSKPVLIEKLRPGQRIRYTASVYGYKDLRDGQVGFAITVCQQNGNTGDQRQFTLQTQR